MELAKVVGTVVATRKNDSLTGKKLMLVQPLTADLLPKGDVSVMVDTAGAGVGEVVLYVRGGASRNAIGQKDAAIDSAIVGIVDIVEVNGITYRPED